MLKTNLQVNICKPKFKLYCQFVRTTFSRKFTAHKFVLGVLFPTFYPKLKSFRLTIGSKTVCNDDGRLCALNFLYLSI